MVDGLDDVSIMDSHIDRIIDSHIDREMDRAGGGTGSREGGNVLRGLQTTPVSGVNVMYTVSAPQTSYTSTTLLTALNTAIRYRYRHTLATHSLNSPITLLLLSLPLSSPTSPPHHHHSTSTLIISALVPSPSSIPSTNNLTTTTTTTASLLLPFTTLCHHPPLSPFPSFSPPPSFHPSPLLTALVPSPILSTNTGSQTQWRTPPQVITTPIPAPAPSYPHTLLLPPHVVITPTPIPTPLPLCYYLSLLSHHFIITLTSQLPLPLRNTPNYVIIPSVYCILYLATPLTPSLQPSLTPLYSSLSFSHLPSHPFTTHNSIRNVTTHTSTLPTISEKDHSRFCV